MAVKANNRKVVGYLACLLGLFVLFYYGTNQGVKSPHQSVHDEGIEVVSVAQSHPVKRVESGVVSPEKDDASPPDFVDTHPAYNHRGPARDHVGIDEPLDIDGPGLFDSARLSQLENVGVFLDVDGEANPGSSDVLPVQNVGRFLDLDGESNEQSSSDTPIPQNAGAFLEVDGTGSNSDFNAGNESVEVNTGKYIDLDG